MPVILEMLRSCLVKLCAIRIPTDKQNNILLASETGPILIASICRTIIGTPPTSRSRRISHHPVLEFFFVSGEYEYQAAAL